MNARKFYRTVFQVEVLSESPIGAVELDTLHHMITEGECSGDVKIMSRQKLDGKQAAKALLKQGSDPGLFNLDHHGKGIDRYHRGHS